jgi:hypothetical protein
MARDVSTRRPCAGSSPLFLLLRASELAKAPLDPPDFQDRMALLDRWLMPAYLAIPPALRRG